MLAIKVLMPTLLAFPATAIAALIQEVVSMMAFSIPLMEWPLTDLKSRVGSRMSRSA
jgi:hypothetical protein